MAEPLLPISDRRGLVDMVDLVLTTVGREFGDLSLAHAIQLFVRLLVAAVMGGLLGWERERAGKDAGLRTHILVSVGAAAFVAIPQQKGLDMNGLARILQGLITGIGFLGAGCIMKEEAEGRVRGLTTAAGVWLTAGVGVSAGMGRDTSAVLLGAFGYFTLSALGRWEMRIKPGGEPPEQIKSNV